MFITKGVRSTHWICSISSLKQQFVCRHIILFWFQSNHSLLLFLCVGCLMEKQQIPIL